MRAKDWAGGQRGGRGSADTSWSIAAFVYTARTPRFGIRSGIRHVPAGSTNLPPPPTPYPPPHASLLAPFSPVLILRTYLISLHARQDRKTHAPYGHAPIDPCTRTYPPQPAPLDTSSPLHRPDSGAGVQDALGQAGLGTAAP